MRHSMPPRLLQYFTGGFLFLLVLSLPGCISLHPDRTPPSLHLFEVELGPPSQQAATGAGLVIVVNMPRAAPGYDTAAMAYMRHPGQLEYFAFHRWADRPARMLQPLLVQALDRTGSFRAVVQAPTPVRGDVTLDSELLRLRQVFPPSGPGFVELSLRLQLTAADNTVLATRVFEKSMQTASADPQAGVAAFDRLLEKLLPEIAMYCAAPSRTILKRNSAGIE